MNAPLTPHISALFEGATAHDPDPLETAEWRDAFVALTQAHGAARLAQEVGE